MRRDAQVSPLCILHGGPQADFVIIRPEEVSGVHVLKANLREASDVAKRDGRSALELARVVPCILPWDEDSAGVVGNEQAQHLLGFDLRQGLGVIFKNEIRHIWGGDSDTEEVRHKILSSLSPKYPPYNLVVDIPLHR